MSISLLLFIIGLIVVFGSVSWGIETANTFLSSQGGSMDSAQFMIVLQEYINTYRWAGSILSIVSGFCFVKAVELR